LVFDLSTIIAECYTFCCNVGPGSKDWPFGMMILLYAAPLINQR